MADLKKDTGNMNTEDLFPQAKVPEGVEDDPHGPLVEFSYNLSTHSMMAGGGGSRSRKIEWNSDGTVIYSDRSGGGGRSSCLEYRLTPEAAQMVRDFVKEKRLAKLSKMDIQTPMVYDCFTSATIAMHFDDSGIGGSPWESCTIYCGPTGMTYRSLEDQIGELFKKCEETGECIRNEEKTTQDGRFGFSGMGGFMMMGPPEQQRQGTSSPGQPVNQPEPRRTAVIISKDKWICSCGTEASGKFCPECGNARPAGWICSCGTENTGRFCTNCGKPR
ncbi:MAG: hypothetical protein J6P32_01895 [Stomatobaculum sp.]|nr:hypothetical protein [Stomatobaculum sp.]